MRFESHLEALAREKAESAHSVADYFTRIGRPAIVNKFDEAVHDIHPTSSCHTDQTVAPETATKTGFSDEKFAKMHQAHQSRFSHPHLDDVLKEKRQRFQQLRKMGIIPTPAERNVFFRKVVFPSAQEVWKKSGDEVILLRSNPTSAADVERIVANAPARRAAAADPVIKADHQARKNDFAYWRSLKKTNNNRQHREKAKPRVTPIRPTDPNRQDRLF